MSRQRYPEELKIEAIKQVAEENTPVADVAQRMGMSVHSLYAWIRFYSTKNMTTKVTDSFSGG